MTAPVSSATQWGELIERVAAEPALRPLTALPENLAAGVLAAPAAVARWIAAAAPALAERRQLSVLVIGAEILDAPDEGRWYSAIPALLGIPARAAATLVGAELTATASEAASCAPPVAARCVKGHLDAFLRDDGGRRYDVAVVFHPGFQKHRGWLNQDGFAQLLAAGTRVVIVSCGTDEYEVERWVAECYGYTVTAPLESPFYLDLSDDLTSIHWGRVIWEFAAAPPAGATTNQARLAALDRLTTMVMHSIAREEGGAPPHGVKVMLASGDNVRRTLIHIFDNRFVEPANGMVVRLVNRQPVDAFTVPRAVIDDYPGMKAPAIDRAVWAAGVKADYLLSTYPAATHAGDSAVASRMFAAMRAKAFTFLRK